MEIVILVIHVILALSVIGVILLQPPESSSLGGLGGSNAMAGNVGRGQANLLTRATAILATGFIITSLVLAILAGHKPKSESILDEAKSSPAMNAPKEAAPTAPVAPQIVPVEPKSAPSVPLTR